MRPRDPGASRATGGRAPAAQQSGAGSPGGGSDGEPGPGLWWMASDPKRSRCAGSSAQRLVSGPVRAVFKGEGVRGDSHANTLANSLARCCTSFVSLGNPWEGLGDGRPRETRHYLLVIEDPVARLDTAKSEAAGGCTTTPVYVKGIQPCLPWLTPCRHLPCSTPSQPAIRECIVSPNGRALPGGTEKKRKERVSHATPKRTPPDNVRGQSREPAKGAGACSDQAPPENPATF